MAKLKAQTANAMEVVRAQQAAKERGAFDEAAIRANEGEVFTTAGKLEIGVQLAPGIESVLGGSEDHEVFARAQIEVREGPFVEVGLVISEKPAVQSHGRFSRIEDLDPVLCVAVFISQAILVGGHELGDHQGLCHQRAGRQGESEGEGQRCQKKSDEGVHREIAEWGFFP